MSFEQWLWTDPDAAAAGAFVVPQKATTAEDLLRAIDAVLQPKGVVRDLSRIIAQFARPFRWAESSAWATDDQGRATNLCRGKDSITNWNHEPWVWLLSADPLGEFPTATAAAAAAAAGATSSSSSSSSAAADAKVATSAATATASRLRVWTVRVDCDGPSTLFIGICKPSTAPFHDYCQDPRALTLCPVSPNLFRGTEEEAIGLPFSVGGDSSGSLYQFTADLSTGTLTVRPKVMDLAPDCELSSQTEWTMGQGIADLADCHAAVCTRLSREDAVTLLPGPMDFSSAATATTKTGWFF
jgi:hypothetical protein